MVRTVVLLHSCPGEPDHFDWLIDQPELLNEHRLLTFRCSENPELGTKIEAIRAPNHRAVYLDYEGEISSNRGDVVQVATGKVVVWEAAEDRIRCVVDWGDGPVEMLAARAGSRWVFQKN